MEHRPPADARPRRFVVALFVAVTWAAASFAVAGILAVLLDRDPVESPAPVYAGPAALALAGVAVWLAVGVTARARRPWVGALAATASAPSQGERARVVTPTASQTATPARARAAGPA